MVYMNSIMHCYCLQDMSAGEQFTVLTDRSEGGASIHDGEVELMVHLTF